MNPLQALLPVLLALLPALLHLSQCVLCKTHVTSYSTLALHPERGASSVPLSLCPPPSLCHCMSCCCYICHAAVTDVSSYCYAFGAGHGGGARTVTETQAPMTRRLVITSLSLPADFRVSQTEICQRLPEIRIIVTRACMWRFKV